MTEIDIGSIKDGSLCLQYGGVVWLRPCQNMRRQIRKARTRLKKQIRRLERVFGRKLTKPTWILIHPFIPPWWSKNTMLGSLAWKAHFKDIPFDPSETYGGQIEVTADVNDAAILEVMKVQIGEQITPFIPKDRLADIELTAYPPQVDPYFRGAVVWKLRPKPVFDPTQIYGGRLTVCPFSEADVLVAIQLAKGQVRETVPPDRLKQVLLTVTEPTVREGGVTMEGTVEWKYTPKKEETNHEA